MVESRSNYGMSNYLAKMDAGSKTFGTGEFKKKRSAAVAVLCIRLPKL